MNTDNVLEQYRREIINQTVQDLLEKFTSLMSTSLAVLNGHKANLDEVRGEPRHKKVVVKTVARKKRVGKTCPVDGCKSVFAPRFGGFCKKHRVSSGYRAWRTRKTASEFVTVTKAKLKKAAKKR